MGHENQYSSFRMQGVNQLSPTSQTEAHLRCQVEGGNGTRSHAYIKEVSLGPSELWYQKEIGAATSFSIEQMPHTETTVNIQLETQRTLIS